MSNYANQEMFEFMSQFLSKSDIYSARAIAKISAFILKYRKKANMSQKSFAEMMGVSQGMVSKWESAEYNFSIENIAHISEKLNVTFDIEFIEESEYYSNKNSNEYEAFEPTGEWGIPAILDFTELAA